MQRAIIHYYRYNRPPATYIEGFIEDDGQCLRTCTVIPAEFAARLAEAWISDGLLPAGTVIHSLRKYLFYGEYFNILELLGPGGEVLGYYSDIVTPLEKNQEGEYVLHDLILDLWIFPDGQIRELDWDEFADAERRSVISQKLAAIARRTLARLAREARAGIFPGAYVGKREDEDGQNYR